MSKRNNVHSDHYKLAGRDRPGDAMPKPPKQQPRLTKGERNSGKAPGSGVTGAAASRVAARQRTTLSM